MYIINIQIPNFEANGTYVIAAPALEELYAQCPVLQDLIARGPAESYKIRLHDGENNALSSATFASLVSNGECTITRSVVEQAQTQTQTQEQQPNPQTQERNPFPFRNGPVNTTPQFPFGFTERSPNQDQAPAQPVTPQQTNPNIAEIIRKVTAHADQFKNENPTAIIPLVGNFFIESRERPESPEKGVHIQFFSGVGANYTKEEGDNWIWLKAPLTIRDKDITRASDSEIHKYSNYLLEKGMEYYGQISAIRAEFVTALESLLERPFTEWFSLQAGSPWTTMEETTQAAIENITQQSLAVRHNLTIIDNTQRTIEREERKEAIREDLTARIMSSGFVENLLNITERHHELAIQQNTNHHNAWYSASYITKNIKVRVRQNEGVVYKNLGKFFVRTLDGKIAIIPLSPEGKLHPALTESNNRVEVVAAYFFPLEAEFLENHDLCGLIEAVQKILEKPSHNIPNYERLFNAPAWIEETAPVAENPAPEEITPLPEPEEITTNTSEDISNNETPQIWESMGWH